MLSPLSTLEVVRHRSGATSDNSERRSSPRTRSVARCRVDTAPTAREKPSLNHIWQGCRTIQRKRLCLAAGSLCLGSVGDTRKQNRDQEIVNRRQGSKTTHQLTDSCRQSLRYRDCLVIPEGTPRWILCWLSTWHLLPLNQVYPDSYKGFSILSL